MINFQRPAFPDLINFCYKNWYTKLLYCFRSKVYMVMALETQEQVNKTT